MDVLINEENQLFYKNLLSGELELGTPLERSQDIDENDWLCAIKIDKKHIQLFTGEQLLEAQIEAMELEIYE